MAQPLRLPLKEELFPPPPPPHTPSSPPHSLPFLGWVHLRPAIWDQEDEEGGFWEGGKGGTGDLQFISSALGYFKVLMQLLC